MRPLLELARKRLSGRNIIAVMSGKGGVGKSVVASILAMALPSTALIDLDIFGTSIPKLFGIQGLHRVGREGIEPFQIAGIKLFSLGGIAGDRYVVLPGSSQAGVVEALLAFAHLGDAVNVVIDMPPGMGEELLTLARVASFKPVVVTTPSNVSLRVAMYLIQYLGEMGLRPRAAVINMARLGDLTPFGDPQAAVEMLAPHVDIVVEAPLDPGLESYMGRLDRYRGPVYMVLEKIAHRL